MDPSNSQVLWASTYQRRRTACCMNGGGPGSGIWKSTDGGETWTRLKGGVLDGPLGRIAIDVYRKRPNILYALIEGPAAGGRGGRGAGGGGRRAGRARGGAGGSGSGRRARRRWRAERRADRHVSIGRCRRDVAEGEQREPAPDVLQPGADRSQRPRSRVSRRRRPPPDDRRRQDHQHRRRVADPFGSPRDLGQPVELEPRPHRQRRRPGRVVRHVEDVESSCPTFRSGSSTT